MRSNQQNQLMPPWARRYASSLGQNDQLAQKYGSNYQQTRSKFSDGDRELIACPEHEFGCLRAPNSHWWRWRIQDTLHKDKGDWCDVVFVISDNVICNSQWYTPHIKSNMEEVLHLGISHITASREIREYHQLQRANICNWSKRILATIIMNILQDINSTTNEWWIEEESLHSSIDMSSTKQRRSYINFYKHKKIRPVLLNRLYEQNCRQCDQNNYYKWRDDMIDWGASSKWNGNGH